MDTAELESSGAAVNVNESTEYCKNTLYLSQGRKLELKATFTIASGFRISDDPVNHILHQVLNSSAVNSGSA
jgi:hypothetical protein